MSYKHILELIKKTKDIKETIILRDGLEIDWNNQFNLITVETPLTQEKLNQAIKQHCKFIVCRDTIHGTHMVFGKESYYTNLDLPDTPPNQNLQLFQLYAKKTIEVNVGSSFLEKIEGDYRTLCRANKIKGELGSVFC